MIKASKLGTFKLDTMGNIFNIRGNLDMLCVSQERGVKSDMETYSVIV